MTDGFSPLPALHLAATDREAVFVLALDARRALAQGLPPIEGETPGHDDAPAAHALARIMGLPVQTGPSEAFDLILPEDLEGVGLARYLCEGLGLDEAQLAPDRDRLNALRDPVVLLYGSVAGNDAMHLALPDYLRVVGRYTPPPVHVDLAPLPSPAGHGSAALGSPAAPAPRRSIAWVALAVLCGLVIAVLVLVASGMGRG